MTNTIATSEPEPPLSIPPLTRGWRMQMAMDRAGHSREHMALVLGVSASTVSRWMHDQGKRQPRRPDMETFARECNVPIKWLAPDDADEMVEQPAIPTIPRSLTALLGGGFTTSPRSPLLHILPDSNLSD